MVNIVKFSGYNWTMLQMEVLGREFESEGSINDYGTFGGGDTVDKEGARGEVVTWVFKPNKTVIPDDPGTGTWVGQGTAEFLEGELSGNLKLWLRNAPAKGILTAGQHYLNNLGRSKDKFHSLSAATEEGLVGEISITWQGSPLTFPILTHYGESPIPRETDWTFPIRPVLPTDTNTYSEEFETLHRVMLHADSLPIGVGANAAETGSGKIESKFRLGSRWKKES